MGDFRDIMTQIEKKEMQYFKDSISNDREDEKMNELSRRLKEMNQGVIYIHSNLIQFFKMIRH
jgi:hypothetical protein